jgi:hypothetical protein
MNPLNLAKVSKLFGFAVPLHVDANIMGRTGKVRWTDYKRRCKESKTKDGEGVEKV